MFRARGLERQIDDANADLLAALLQLRNCATISFGPPQKLIGSTRLTLAGRRPSPATLVEFQQRGGDPVVQRVRL